MADNLIQKKDESTWYVVKQIPKDVRRARGNRSTFTKSRKTGLRSEAMKLRLYWLAQWEADIAAARHAKAGNGDEWRLAQHTVGKDLQQRRTDAVTQIYTPMSADAAPADISWFEKLSEMVRALRDEGQNEIADRLTSLARKHIDVLENGVNAGEGIELQNEFLMIIGELEAACIAEEYDLSDDEHREAQAIARNPKIYKPASPITTARLADFRVYRVKSGVALKTIDQQESKLKKLSHFLRAEGKTLNVDSVSTWLDTLGLTSKTKAQYLLAGSTFWKWAIKNDARWQEDFVAKDNPFTGHELPKLRAEEKAKTKRKAYALDELVSIYEAAKAEDQEALCDLITLGFYTGARIEELAQLRAESIIIVEGVRTIDIDKAKSYAGVRQVPVHPLLAPVIDRLIKTNPEGYLLPSSGGNKYGIRSDPLSKAFGRLKTSLGFGRQHVFHSVRSTTITLLLRGGVPGPTVANIVGHETGLVTFDVYDEGASPKQKLDALSKLDFNLIT